MVNQMLSRKLLLLSVCLSGLFASTLLADQETFSPDRLEAFYNGFGCEQKDMLAEAGLTLPCTGPCGPLTPRPTIAPLAQQRTSGSQVVPFVLVNNTGMPDSEVYFVIYGLPVSGCSGTTPITGDFSFVSFGAQPGPFNPVGVTGGAAQATGANTPPSATYSYAFSDIPLSNGQRIIYIPPIGSGIMLYSIGSPLDLTVNSNSIAIPVVTDPSDASYNTVYGGMELTFYPSTCTMLNQLTVDFTCVDYYGLSIYFNLYTSAPLPGIPQNRASGIYQSRHYTLCNLQNTLATASSTALSQWQGLVLSQGSKILRVASPGYAMSHTGGSFDPNYLDNAAAYGYSWASNVWTGANAYYNTHQLQVTTIDTTLYNGQTSGGNFLFTDAGNTQNIYSIPWSDVSSPTTSTSIFNVEVFFPGMEYSSNGGTSYTPVSSLSSAIQTNATEITQYLSASIAAGLIPGKVTSLTPAGFPPSTISTYYTPNTNLTPPGSTTGPWYDLYSLGIHANSSVTGTAVYTYAYDDYLYSQAPVSSQVAPSQATIDDTTFVTVVLGPYTDN